MAVGAIQFPFRWSAVRSEVNSGTWKVSTRPDGISHLCVRLIASLKGLRMSRLTIKIGMLGSDGDIWESSDAQGLEGIILGVRGSVERTNEACPNAPNPPIRIARLYESRGHLRPNNCNSAALVIVFEAEM